MKNDTLKSIIVLTSICLITALLLSGANLLTAPIIADAEQGKESSSFLDVLPDADTLIDVELGSDAPASVLALKKAANGSGYAFKFVINGYSGVPMNAIVGIGSDGKIIKLSFIEYTDSPGIGSPEGFDALFRGKDNSTADNDSGATVTTNAIKLALSDVYAVLAAYSDIEQSDEQKLSGLWEKLMPSAVTPAGAYSFAPADAIESADPSIVAVYAPSNEIGYVYLIKSAEDKSVAVAVNAFGKAYKVLDLDGNDLTDDAAYTAAKQTAENAQKPIYLAKEKVNTRMLTNAFKTLVGEDKADSLTISAIELPAVSSSVVSSYKVSDGKNEYYTLSAQVVGYGGTVKVLYVFDNKGDIVLYKTTSHSESSGYGAAIADKSYAEKLVGKDISELSDSDILISGATVTSNAVKLAKNDIKAAFEALKEVI